MDNSIYQFKILYDSVNFYLPDPQDHIQKTIISNHNFYEYEMLKDIFESLLPGDVTIDVGANIGNHSLFIGKYCNPEKVYSFEPFPYTHSILKKNIEINNLENKIIPIPYAVGSKHTKGSITLPNQNNLGTATFNETSDGDTEVITLDEYFTDKLQRLDLIKIDVEGMELDVLKGATNLIKKFHPKIYIECAEKDEFESVYSFLSQFDYELLAKFNATPTYSFIHKPSEDEKSKKKQIAFFAGDNNHFHFLDPFIRYMVEQGYTAKKYLWEGNNAYRMLNIMKNSDLAWFDWGNGPIIEASNLPKFCPIINRVHKYEIYQEDIKKINFNNIDKLIFVGDLFLEEFKKYVDTNIENKTKVNIVPNPVGNSIQFIERKKGKNIAYISRFHQDKNPLLMVDILEKLISIDPAYKIYMIGRVQDNELYNTVQKKLREKGLANNFIYEGIINDVESWLQDKSILLSTATIESQGMGIMEAMMSGIKPVLYDGFGLNIYPEKYRFQTVDEAIAMIESNDYNSYEYREFVEKLYSSNVILPKIKELIEQSINRQRKHFDYEPFVSICVPTYNRAEFLTRCISSALAQTYEKFEVVIIDDGSTDNTEEIVKSFNSSKIRYIRKEHSGIPQTRNRAIEVSSGEYILWLDSDDEISPYLLEKYIETMNNYPDADVFYCNLLTIDSETNEIGSRVSFDWYNQEYKSIYYQIVHGIALYIGGLLIKKKIFNEIGDFNIHYKRGQDYEFISRLLVSQKYKLKSINEFGYVEYFHDSNISGKMTVNVDKHYERQSIKDIFRHLTIDKIFFQYNWEDNFEQSLVQALGELTNQFVYYNSIVNTKHFLELSNSIVPSEDKANKIQLLQEELQKLQNTIKQIENNYSTITDNKTQQQYEYLKHILEEEEINLQIPRLLDLDGISAENTPIINKPKTGKDVLIIMDDINSQNYDQAIIQNGVISLLQSKEYSIDIVTSPSQLFDGINTFHFDINENINSKKTLREIYRLANFIENANYTAIIIFSQLDDWIGKALEHIHNKYSNLLLIPNNFKDLFEKANINPKISYLLKKVDSIISFNNLNIEDSSLNNVHFISPVIFVQELNNQILIKDNFKTKYNLQHKHFALVNSNFVSGSNTASLIKTFINEPGDFDIVIIGNKISGKEEYFDYCTELARYDDRITIIPGLPPDEVNEAIKEADILLIPSLGESAGPLVLLQTMHFKTPWIATPYCNSALDEAGGIIAELKDFPKYVRVLLDNPQIANELGELGYQHQQRTFSFEKSIDAFVSLIEGKNEIPDFKMPNEIRNEQNVISQKIKQLANYQQYQSEEYVFSIIIPTFNRSDVLMMCLDAINKQTFPHNKFEVIVIDDGSTDDTEQKIRNFPNTFKLTYIKQINSGPGPARNKGILFAKGEYSLILNDDAIMDPYNLEAHFMSHLTKYNGQKVAVIGKFDYSEEFIERPFVWLTQNTNVIFSYNLLEPNKPFDYKYFWTCNISLKTAALIEAGLFDENFSEPMMEDSELGYRLQMLGYNVYFEPEAKSTHYHWIDVPGFVKRQKMNGRNVLKFLMKYPHTLYSEKNVFGINALDASGIAEMRFRHTSMADDAINMTRLLSEIDNKLKIKVEESYITLPDKSILELEEFKEQMKNAAYFLHNYNYLSGILDQLEKQNFDLTYIRKPLSGPERILEKFVKYSEIKENITSINNINENNYTNEFADNDYLNILQDDYKPNYVVVEKSNNLSDINKNRKILFTMYGWDENGGGTQLPRSIAIELSKAGFDIAVFYAAGKHPMNNTPYYLEEKLQNNIHLYGVYNRPTAFLDEANPHREIRDDKVVELFNNVLDIEQPDIVHFHNFLGLSFAIAESAKSRNIPTLFTPHNYHLIDPELYMFDMGNQFKKWKNIDFFANSNLPKKHPDLITDYKIRRQSARNLLANQIDYVLAISQREADILVEFSEHSDNIYVINQVSKICDELAKTNFTHPLYNPLRFGFIGSILIHKGIHIIYQAAEMLKNAPVEFYLYGMGSPDLISALSKSFPNSKVFYKGSYSENDLFNIAKEVDAIIIPSIWEEGGPLTAPESIAMGVPIIGANIGGIPDFVQDGINGFLYQYDNPASLANKIQQIIDNNDLIMKFKDNLKLSFTFQDYISHISLIYQNITNKKHLRREDIELRFNQISIPSNSFIKPNNEVKIPLENNHNSIIYKPLMLHLGSQGVVLDGFDNLDAQPQSSKEIQCDVRQLPYQNETVDMIMAIDLLQVYSHRETDAVLKEWTRVVKKGGAIILSVPDLKRILNDYYNGNLTIGEANQYIFGKQANDYDYHYNGFDDVSLQKHLQLAGLQVVELKHESNSMPRLIVRAVKI